MSVCLLASRAARAQADPNRPLSETPPAPAEVAPAPPVVEIEVRGARPGERMRRSAQAVEVLELARAQRSSADLGEVLARGSNLKVQRQGGLGSSSRYSLDGLSGDRVRFFLDGVPLELTAYQLGVANVPVGLVERVEIYRGVVPVRFGADALGGAVNLVSDESVRGARASASYQFGSYGTHRLSGTARVYSESLRGFARGSFFLDRSANDYPVDVQVFDDAGQVSTARLRRFHDGYSGAGATLGVGLLQRPWADRVVLQGYVSGFRRDVQHNGNMSVPYGEVTYGRDAAGGNLSYRKRWGKLRLDALGDYNLRSSHFRDVSRCRYDWYGRCFVMLPLPGEIDAVALDRHLDERTVFGRAELSYAPLTDHLVRVAASTRFVERDGHDDALKPDAYDPLRAARKLFTGVVGAEYEITAGRLAKIAFAKAYYQRAKSEERLLTALTRTVRAEELSAGAGDSLRWTLTEGLYAKGSFEYAARLPNADERFGDGGLIAENTQLEPERSQNVNLSLGLERRLTALGAFAFSVNGSGRRVESMVVLLNNGGYFQYSNVLAARALAVDARASWNDRRDRFGLQGGASYQDLRNTSKTGPGALFEGDRIPNQPFFQVSAGVFARARDLARVGDELELAYDVRHVGEFFLGWESAAANGSKLTVPSQTVHALSLTHVTPAGAARLSNSFEVHNLTNAKVFDFYGVERPGRIFAWKLGLEYQ
jgi:outer membrane receptor protein involved in Fe transport